MKATFNRERLFSAFQMAAMVAPTRSPKPILQNVKLVVEEGVGEFLATDSEIGIRVGFDEADVSAPGACVLSVARFGAILRESADELLKVESDGTNITIKGTRSSFKLTAVSPDEFPNTGDFNESKFHLIQSKLLKELTRRTIFATDSESSRYALGGVLLEFGENTVIAVGTDGRRLAKMEGTATSVEGHQSTPESTTIIPSRAMQLIERAISDDDSEVKVAATANELKLQTSNITLVSRLVEGRFPRWQDVLVERPDAKRIQITVGPFYGAVRQAAIVASEESRGIDFCFGDGSLVMSGATAEVGQSRIELPIPYDGDRIEVSLDHRFVTDFLKVLGVEKSVTLTVKDDENPAEFSTDDGYTYVVMPMSRDAKKK